MLSISLIQFATPSTSVHRPSPAPVNVVHLELQFDLWLNCKLGTSLVSLLVSKTNLALRGTALPTLLNLNFGLGLWGHLWRAEILFRSRDSSPPGHDFYCQWSHAKSPKPFWHSLYIVHIIYNCNPSGKRPESKSFTAANALKWLGNSERGREQGRGRVSEGERERARDGFCR